MIWASKTEWDRNTMQCNATNRSQVGTENNSKQQIIFERERKKSASRGMQTFS